MSNKRVSAVVLSLVLVISATTAAVPASAFTPDAPLGVAGNTSGNDATTTLTETTTTVANDETPVTETTTAGNDETTTVNETTTTTAKRPGASDRKPNPKVSSALADQIDSDGAGPSTDGTGGTEFVQVVVRSSAGRSDEVAGLVEANGGDVQVRHESLVQARVPEAAVGTDSVEPGETVEVTATVENAGDGAGVASANSRSTASRLAR